MVYTLMLAVVLGLSSSGVTVQPGAVADPDTIGCPPVHGRSEGRVQMVLSSPFLPEMRERFNLGTSSVESIRLLTDEQDRAVCRDLWRAVIRNGTRLPDDAELTFYKSGDTFFVPITRDKPPPGVVRLDGTSTLDIYDAELHLVGRFRA